MSSLRFSNTSERPMEASKWLKCPILVDADEIRNLFDALGTFSIFLTSCVCKRNGGEISRAEFLDCYSQYIETLKSGKIPDEASYRHQFSSVFTVNSDALYAIPIGDDQQLIRIAKPVIQLQSHRMDYSQADHKFRSMTFGSDSLVWGIQFTYPQLYKDSGTQEIHQVLGDAEFPNTQLFQQLQRWVRANTVPTPFLVGEEKINIPVRLGKHCFSWINKHPQLPIKNLRVITQER